MSEQTKNVNFTAECKQGFANWRNHPDTLTVDMPKVVIERVARMNKKEAQHE